MIFLIRIKFLFIQHYIDLKFNNLLFEKKCMGSQIFKDRHQSIHVYHKNPSILKRNNKASISIHLSEINDDSVVI